MVSNQRSLVTGVIIGVVMGAGLLLMVISLVPITTIYVNPYISTSVFAVSLVLLAAAVIALKPENQQPINADT